MSILVLNIGSSSQKCAVFSAGKCTWQAHLKWKEHYSAPQLELLKEGKKVFSENISAKTSKEGLECILKKLLEEKYAIKAFGHRIVHGGEKYTKATLITTEVKKDILSLSEFAPLHNRENLEGIEVSEKFFPEASQFAVFDTAFHSTLPEEIATYPGPYHWKKEGIRRYGFHGISFQYCSVQASQFLNRSLRELKMVICHLGNGASLCAIKEGKSFDTTMGFTPLEGLMMGTRSGTVDPSILFYLLRQGKDVDSIEKILNFQSGLLGISGISEDIREIEEAALRGEKRAKLSLEMFLYRLRGFIGMMIASLEGIDVLVFTGGIGEHSSLVRKETCKSLSYLGLEVDSKANDEKSKEDRAISGKASKVSILVIPTNEEKEIAQEGMRLFSD